MLHTGVLEKEGKEVDLPEVKAAPSKLSSHCSIWSHSEKVNFSKSSPIDFLEWKSTKFARFLLLSIATGGKSLEKHRKTATLVQRYFARTRKF